MQKTLCDQCGRTIPEIQSLFSLNLEIQGFGGSRIDLCNEDLSGLLKFLRNSLTPPDGLIKILNQVPDVAFVKV